ncbi:hypothetical protein T265_01613 [Opisthorchis viverrini]|uniref:Ion transport domain-containing protein n=1 Tax=Opisthorchis viverrini TaxID=6198 RepID=A0A074ZZ88_OPIVI|nr:hypothetical protein T265_01613 [Opisthorchis viverrini]KER32391.1 hypothetical protein T265_01613 [Opisthorchis viverrini]
MFCIRDFEGMQRFQFLLIFLPLLPLLYFIYLFFPKFRMPLPQALIFRDRGSIKYELATILRCPVIKFVGYMVSYVTFLILITVATFRLDRNDLVDEEANWERRSMEIWSYDFRTNNVVMTKIQIILLFWILENFAYSYSHIFIHIQMTISLVLFKIPVIACLLWIISLNAGQLGMECKQVYYFGLRYFFRSYYNVMDWAGIAIYLASYSLRIIVDFKVQSALTMYRDELRTAHELLNNATRTGIHVGPGFDVHTDTDYVNYRNHILLPSSAYWLRGSRMTMLDPCLILYTQKIIQASNIFSTEGRLWWASDDPEYVSDCLFALGNVLSFARISHLMPAWELLGPLQISLARMVTDIIRFMALFSVVCRFLEFVKLSIVFWVKPNHIDRLVVDYEEDLRCGVIYSKIPTEHLQTAGQGNKTLLCILFIKTECPSSTRTRLLELSWIFIDYYSNILLFKRREEDLRENILLASLISGILPSFTHLKAPPETSVLPATTQFPDQPEGADVDPPPETSVLPATTQFPDQPEGADVDLGTAYRKPHNPSTHFSSRVSRPSAEVSRTSWRTLYVPSHGIRR